MIRVVADANILVSAAITRDARSPPAAILDAALDGRVELVTSPATAPDSRTSAPREPVPLVCPMMWHSVALGGIVDVVAEHYTLRLAPGMRERLTERARRSRLPERTLAQRYVEEGLRHDAYPLIQFLDGPSGRRASLIGRGVDVWEVIATVVDNGGSITDAAAYLEIPRGLVEAAVSYYGEYHDEIDEEIALNEAEYQRGRAAATSGTRALGT